jgi:hypothetical protein
MSTKVHQKKRSGNTLILALFAMIGMFGMVAMAVDIGYLHLVDSELQRTADAAALSGAWELYREKELFGTDPCIAVGKSQGVIDRYAAMNKAGNAPVQVAAADTQIGFITHPAIPNAPIDTSDPQGFNAVRIKVQRSAEINGEVPLFFARVLGFDSRALGAGATAMYLRNFKGFHSPSGEGGGNLQVLPFALDKQTWDAMTAGGGSDSWGWDEEAERITCGPDGIREVNLFPQGTGSPGNRGTVDIGASNNSTSDLARQIVNGITHDDLDYLGGTLELDSNGHLGLNGDTGISAGVKDELASIKGQPRIIPIFDQVVHPGNNAEYRIVQFAGVRIMDVKLTGSMSSKRVIIQPARIQIRGGIPADTGDPKSQFVFSPVWLVQ